MTRRLPALAVIALVCACGSGPKAAPRLLPTDLAPAAVLGGTLHFYRNTAPGTVAAFHFGDKTSLIDDGGLWEIRRKDRLIGTLQIETLKNNVNVHKQSVRDAITSPILVGAPSDIRLSGQEVSTLDSQGGLSTVIWFGDHLLVVLQVKDEVVTGADLAQAVIDYQQSRTSWVPLPELYSPA